MRVSRVQPMRFRGCVANRVELAGCPHKTRGLFNDFDSVSFIVRFVIIPHGFSVMVAVIRLTVLQAWILINQLFFYFDFQKKGSPLFLTWCEELSNSQSTIRELLSLVMSLVDSWFELHLVADCQFLSVCFTKCT